MNMKNLVFIGFEYFHFQPTTKSQSFFSFCVGEKMVLRDLRWASLMVVMVFVAITARNVATAQPTPLLIAEWTTLKYDWAFMQEDPNVWIQDGRYIPNNCALAGVKQYQDRIFVTVPV